MSVIDRMVDTIAEHHGTTKAAAREIVTTMLACVVEHLVLHHECAIPKFGKFALTEREAREGRNPRTGEPVQVPPTTGVRFRPAADLKIRLNPPRQERAGPPTVTQRRAG